MKSFFESKTIWLGALTLIVSVLAFLQGEEWIKNYPQIVAGIGTIIGVLMVVLRFFTDTPMKLSVQVKKSMRKK